MMTFIHVNHFYLSIISIAQLIYIIDNIYIIITSQYSQSAIVDISVRAARRCVDGAPMTTHVIM